jgi:hypothetical protein
MKQVVEQERMAQVVNLDNVAQVMEQDVVAQVVEQDVVAQVLEQMVMDQVMEQDDVTQDHGLKEARRLESQDVEMEVDQKFMSNPAERKDDEVEEGKHHWNMYRYLLDWTTEIQTKFKTIKNRVTETVELKFQDLKAKINHEEKMMHDADLEGEADTDEECTEMLCNNLGAVQDLESAKENLNYEMSGQWARWGRDGRSKCP